MKSLQSVFIIIVINTLIIIICSGEGLVGCGSQASVWDFWATTVSHCTGECVTLSLERSSSVLEYCTLHSECDTVQLRVQLNKCDTVQLWVSHSGERTFCQTVTGKDSPGNCAAVAATPLRPCEYLDNCDITVNHPPTLPSSWKITHLTMPCIFCSRYSFLGSPCPNWRFLTIYAFLWILHVKCAPNPKYNPGIFVKLSISKCIFL